MSWREGKSGALGKCFLALGLNVPYSKEGKIRDDGLKRTSK